MFIVEVAGLSQNLVNQVIALLWNDPSFSPNEMIYYWKADQGLLDSPSVDAALVRRSRAFRRWFRDTFEDRIRGKYLDIEYRMHNGVLTVYRELTAPANWQPDPNQHPGQYWSWDEHAAEAHWGSYEAGEVAWVIVGQVVPGAIDWVSTLAKNASFDYEDEKEIELKPGAKVSIVRYFRPS